jgi:predicted secreted protein with PEFG-CTERM motif
MRIKGLAILAGLVLLAGAVASGGPAYAEPFACTATLDGGQEVPPVDSEGGGTATIDFDSDTNELTWEIEFSELSGPATAAHFHGPAEEGENAGVQVNIGEVSGLESPMSGSAELTAEQAQMLLDGQMYINIHTEQNPDGEIRGQVSCEPESDDGQAPGGQTPGGQAGEWQNATLTVGSEEFDIQYMISGGTLDELTADPETQVLTAMITTEEDGELVIQLPRDVIDSTDDAGADLEYIVYVDEIEEFADEENDADIRTLTIPFANQSEQVDIVGTSMVPEFGAITAIVLGVAIVGIIAATAAYGRTRFMPGA